MTKRFFACVCFLPPGKKRKRTNEKGRSEEKKNNKTCDEVDLKR